MKHILQVGDRVFVDRHGSTFHVLRGEVLSQHIGQIMGRPWPFCTIKPDDPYIDNFAVREDAVLLDIRAKPNADGWWWVRSASPRAVDGWLPVWCHEVNGEFRFTESETGESVSVHCYAWGGKVRRA